MFEVMHEGSWPVTKVPEGSFKLALVRTDFKML